MAHWLVKSEPAKYSFENLQRDGKTSWDGVRNNAAAHAPEGHEDGR
jgi:predicted RNA-binding protein with PUA-like domain